MILTFRPIKDWPEGWPRSPRATSQFTATYNDTLSLLDTELEHLGATEAFLQVDASESDCRLDGQLRANAKVGNQGVIITIDTKQHGTLVYSCDVFSRPSYRRDSPAAWQHNLRAIGLGLHDLRRLDRYGIADRGQQYAGFRELGAGIAMPEAMTPDRARRLIADAAECALPANAPLSWWRSRYRDAAKLTHPDQGGDPEQFKLVTEAWTVLSGSDAS